MKELIAKLSGAFGPAGAEAPVREMIKEETSPFSDKQTVDNLGNLVVTRHGSGNHALMVAAHMDEIGLMVTYIDENGFLRFTNVGGVFKKMLVGKKVLFRNGTVGVIGQEKLKEPGELEFSKLYLDIGAGSREEARKKVGVGDMAVFYSPLDDAGEHRVTAKALDNRAGCAVLVEALKKLPHGPLPCPVHFVFTVQEEVGLRGARPASYHLEPAYGLAVDVTRVGDTPEPEYKMDVSLGKGPAVKIKDTSVICHPKVTARMIDVAEKNELPYQLEVLERGGTDAGAIHLSREGVPSGVLSVPCRYIHTPAEMVDLRDVEHAVAFLLKLLEEKWE